MSAERVNPYEHFSEAELERATQEAADLQLRIANSDPKVVLSVLVDAGCPHKDAAGMLTNPQLRLGAFRFYFDTIDARLGNKDAAARVDHVREGWLRMRRARLAG